MLQTFCHLRAQCCFGYMFGRLVICSCVCVYASDCRFSRGVGSSGAGMNRQLWAVHGDAGNQTQVRSESSVCSWAPAQLWADWAVCELSASGCWVSVDFVQCSLLWHSSSTATLPYYRPGWGVLSSVSHLHMKWITVEIDLLEDVNKEGEPAYESVCYLIKAIFFELMG